MISPKRYAYIVQWEHRGTPQFALFDDATQAAHFAVKYLGTVFTGLYQ